MGKPAATLTSMHLCPKVTSKVPHVGGPVVAGSPNVKIGGLSAAREGDSLICVGPPDSISQGSGSVFINGKPAARLGDSTKHGGKIVIGNPTVLIGEKYRADKQPPPTTYEEAKQRLLDAKPYVDAAREGGAAMPGSAYSTADKREVVAEELNERFLFRVQESEYSNDDGYIGPPSEGKARRYWTTTFTQAEHGDTDPEAICKAVGRKYDPTCNYTILLIDHEKAAERGDMVTFIPTYKKIGIHAKAILGSEFKDDLDLIEPCLTPKFSQYYEQVRTSAEATGTEFDEQEDFIEYCHDLGFTPSQTDTLRTRFQIDQRLGANKDFLGNGVTKDLNVSYETTPFGDIDDDLEYGPPETFTWDKNPQILAELEKEGAIMRMNIGNGASR